MTNKILNQLSSSCKKWKTLVLITLLLTLGVGQMWGADTYAIAGSMNGWSTTANQRSGTGAISITFSSTGNYKFKIVKNGTWCGNSGTMTRDNCTNWGFTYNGGDDCTISVDKTGTYTFTITNGTPTLSVIYPDATWSVAGGFNSWSTTANTFSNSKTSVDLTTGTTYEFKIYRKEGSVYYGNSGTMTSDNCTNWDFNTSDGNAKITATVTGTYTFTLVNNTPRISVTYPTTYTLTYSIGSVAGNNGNISTSPTTTSGSAVVSGTSITLTGPAAKTGYKWKGWYTNAAGTEGKITDTNRAITVTMNANKTLYACYTENTYNVKATATTGGSVTPTSNTAMGQITGGDITATADAGYSFTNWTISSGSGYFGTSGTSTTSTTRNTKFRPTAASTLLGTFSEVMRTVSVKVNNSALGTVSTSSLTNVGPVTKSAAVTATPATGATFSNWTLPSGVTAADGYSASSNPIKVNATAASKTITANFSETMHSVTLTNDNSSYGTVNTSSPVSVGQITAVKIQATAKTNYMFSGWVQTAGSGTVTYYTGAGTGQLVDDTGASKATTYICVTGNVTLKATWEEDRSSGFVVHYGNDGKDAEGNTDPSQARAWQDGVLNKPSVAESNTSSFVFTASTSDVDKVIYFKIKKRSPETWYGNNGKIDGTISNWLFETDKNDARLCITMPGNYIFTWDKSTNKLSLTYPSVYYLRGGFNSWAWSHPMTETSSGVYSATVNMTEANHTYSGDNGFKLLIAGLYYGKNSTITRESNTVASCNTSDGNIGITTDFTGNYTFNYTVSTNTLEVVYPAAFKLTYSIGSVAGTSGSISSSPTTTSGSYVLSGNSVTLTAPNAKTGYTWKGWYGAAGGTGDQLCSTKAYAITMNAAKTVYACYTENSYSTTIAVSPAGTGTTTPAAGSQNIKQVSGTSVTATANTNYVFVNWTATGGGITPTSSTTNPQTFKATSASGTITANFADQWNVKGDQWDSWATYNGMPATGTANTFSKSFSLPAKTTYHFKVVKRANAGGSDVWYGVNNGKTLTRASNSVTGLEANGGENEYITFTTDVAGTYTITYLYNSNVNSMKVTVTYPTAYTVTFGKGTGGSSVSASATSAGGSFTSGSYVASGDVVTFSQTPATGYTFKGWYTTVDGNTSAGVNGSNQLTINGKKTVYAQYTPNTYTVSFNNNGGSGATPDPISVTYGAAYGTLPAGPTPPGAEQFVGWSKTPTGTVDLVTAETLVTTASDHTLFARFENTYTVTVQYKCGTQTLRASTTVHASETAVAPEITAPIILGYEFDEWTGDNATFADYKSATTTVHATAATAITANYTAVPMVYFKNNLDWDNVYVSFDNTWTTVDGKQVPSNKGKPYYKMTQLGTSDIFYCEIPSDYVANNYANWKWNIAFDNTNYGSTAETTHTGAWDEFYGGKFLGRGDFDPSATMYIPYDGDTETRNSGTYYRTGCWMKYNSTDPGYKIYANTYVSGSGGTAVGGTPVLLTADVAGGFEFKAKVNFPNADYSYGFMLHKEATKNTNDLWYTNTGAIHSTTTSLPWHFYTDGASENGQRCEIHTEAVGDYEFTVTFGTGRPVVNVTYPVGKGDYRLVYKDLATWSNGAHTADWQHPSRVIKANANAEDIVSFYVSKADGANASIKLHKCTSIDGSGNPVWDKGTTVDLSGISETGIYNFKVTQNESKVATVAFDGSYTGNFYVRTDASDGGWSNYKTSGANTMTYSEYSVTHGGDFGPYSHYFMRHVNSGSNIKFCVANDYSECISDTVVDDTYAHEWIEVEANVRFMWYYGTNKIGRAYVSGSTNVSDRFLVLEGDEHLYDADGHPLTGTYQVEGLNEYEMKFIDDQNWVYETTVQANPLERVKLTAKFNNKIQYFYGAEGDRTEATTHQLIGGTGSDKYKMRVVYDFKTNRLVAAWLPSSAVTTEFDIDADVMIIRYHQADAQQITFSGSGKLKDVQTVYGAMQFNKYRLNNQSEAAGHSDLGLSQYERDLFFISFPFDVKLNDVFGFGQYGKHWIIEYYDGKTRAQNGFWADSPSNWKFVTKAMKDVFTLKANEGYVLALDLDELTMSSSVWDYGVENVYLYFPSTTTIDKIQATSATVDIDQTGYECTINRNTPDGDRRVKDSYWHLLGVPSYANATNTTSGSWTGTVPNQNPDTWTSSAPYLYSWNGHDNKFGVISSTSTTFKPMQSYLVQYAKPTIEWASVNATPKAVAARRAQNQLRDCEFRLQLMQNNEELDHTFISLRDDEEVTAGFDFSYDLSKMLYGAFTSACNVYTLIGEEQAAANCLPLTEQTTVVPVGLKVADDGEYTFSMPDGTNGVGVTLIDGVTGERTNLALTDYTVSLEKGTYDQRFVLEISPIEHTTTAIENSEKTDAPNTVCKKLIDGVLYIIKDGKVFDARGARLQ